MVQRLQSAANKFVRLIFKLDLRESVKDSMQQLGILTINQLAELETADFMNKSKLNLHYTRRITPKRVTSCGARLRETANSF